MFFIRANRRSNAGLGSWTSSPALPDPRLVAMQQEAEFLPGSG